VTAPRYVFRHKAELAEATNLSPQAGAVNLSPPAAPALYELSTARDLAPGASKASSLPHVGEVGLPVAGTGALRGRSA